MDNKHERFTQWAVDRGVEINGVKAACLPGRGLGIVTTKRVKAGERLLFVPARAMFKPNRRLLEDAGLKDASPQAQLAVSAMSEFEPDDSRFALWRSVLPAMRDFEQCMPMLWTDQLQTCLPNPVRQPLERQMADYTRDADTVKEFVTNSHLDEEKFRYYWLIVNSRSFHWKAPSSKAGEMVLCPFIDYMNHAPTGSTCNVIITKKGYEVKANRDYGKSIHLSRNTLHKGTRSILSWILLALNLPLPLVIALCCSSYSTHSYWRRDSRNVRTSFQ